MPVPNRIIPAGYNTDASINDPIGHCHKPPRTCNKIGVATTHIFEYQGASSLAFSLDSSTQVNRAQDSTADYHFHTSSRSLYGFHAAPMFDALLQLMNNFPHGDVSLKPAPIVSPIRCAQCSKLRGARRVRNFPGRCSEFTLCSGTPHVYSAWAFLWRFCHLRRRRAWCRRLLLRLGTHCRTRPRKIVISH